MNVQKIVLERCFITRAYSWCEVKLEAIFSFLSSKLPVSRLQRDLTDSTVLRNIGVPIAHTMIALESLNKGINKLLINEANITADLEKNWIVVAEAIQTILRREPKRAWQENTNTRTNVVRARTVPLNIVNIWGQNSPYLVHPSPRK